MNEEFIWWPAIRDQFKIEFGVDIETRFGGNIANLMYSIHALLDKAKNAPRDCPMAEPKCNAALRQIWTLESYTPQQPTPVHSKENSK